MNKRKQNYLTDKDIPVDKKRIMTLLTKSAGPDDSALAFFNSPYKLSYVGGGSALKSKNEYE